MILSESMQENPEKEDNVVEELIMKFNSMQLNSIRYKKHFRIMEEVVIHENWEELNKVLIAANECENHVYKICENLKSINTLLFKIGNKRL